MISSNLKIQYMKDNLLSNNKQIKSLDKMFSHNKDTYVFIKVKDINKISNTNSECWEIIKEISITSKIKIETNIDCYKYTKET